MKKIMKKIMIWILIIATLLTVRVKRVDGELLVHWGLINLIKYHEKSIDTNTKW